MRSVLSGRTDIVATTLRLFLSGSLKLFSPQKKTVLKTVFFMHKAIAMN
ncbi:MAG: hypothetical protein IIU35_00950 [Neisseriaceae bacterium]|nr:hypothetical protein [Neisseriaceae bacterium]